MADSTIMNERDTIASVGAHEERGSSFVELIFAMAIVGVATLVQVQQVTVSLHQHQVDLDTQFAFHKASGMLAELQASVDQGTISTLDDLEAVADTVPNPFLVTRSVPTPDHVMSGNTTLADGSWRWSRDIDVEPVAGLEHSRFVRIRVFQADANGHRTMAAIASGILSVTVRVEPLVQEYDVYALAIAEAPSLWQPLPTLKAQLEAVASQVSGANPNLRFRLHWITKMGYGRDPLYVPYVNESTRSDEAAPWVYWYPGKLGAGAGASALYKAESFGGRVRTETGLWHDFDPERNPYPHAVADRFNHCMRTPEARELFALRVAAGTDKADEPPLQVLLADMHEQPERFKNAIFVNLHGDGLPFPPLRNYADAAKDPQGRPGVRVVAHPVKLHTPRVSVGTAGAVAKLIADLQAALVDYAGTNAASKLKEALSQAVGAQTKLTQASPRFDEAAKQLREVESKIDDAEDGGYDAAYTTNLRVRDMIADCDAVSDAMGGPELKVYAYKADPASGPAVLTEPITLQIMGLDLTGNVNHVNGTLPTTLEIRRMVGGIDIASGQPSAAAAYDHFFEASGLPPRPGASAAPYEMRYEVGFATTPSPHTWIRLYNTPLGALFCNDPSASDAQNEGLPASERLYGLEYIPSPVETVGRDLDQDGMRPKNTARWRIRIPVRALPAQDLQLTIHTRIGTDVTTGRVWPTPNQPLNVSTTYTWWTASASAVPITERFQFLGDPRHNPYEDLCAGGASFAHGYNWWFDDLRSGSADVSSSWTCLDRARLRDGYGPGGVVDDAPRMLQVWREALQACGAVFSNPGGRLAGRLLLGGEIALPVAVPGGDAGMVPVAGALFGSSGSVQMDDVDAGGVGATMWLAMTAPEGALGDSDDEMVRRSVSATVFGRPVVAASGFVAKSWLGELAPDNEGGFVRDGNLSTSSGYVRMPRADVAKTVLPRGTSWAYPSGSALGELGGASLLQAGGSTTAFVQGIAASGATGTLVTEIHAFSQSVGLAVAPTASARLPFTLSGALSTPLPQADCPSEFPAQDVRLLETFASSDAGNGVRSGVIRVATQTSPARAAYFVPFGDTPATADEHRGLAFGSLALGLRALFVAAEPTRSDDVAPLPSVSIELPRPQEKLTKPDSTVLTWSTSFRRFDGAVYTPGYPADWQGPESSLVYVVTYRRGDETQYYYAVDGSPAEPGVWPDNALARSSDTGLGNESYIVSLPGARFPAGEYALRVDCFRKDRVLHVAHHEVYVKIER